MGGVAFRRYAAIKVAYKTRGLRANRWFARLKPMAKLQFLGAAGAVTGSKYLLEIDGSRLMIDCGLFQGYKELRLRNWDPLPVNPGSVDWVALTHAHIDHSGYLPRFVRAGFDGPVCTTDGTADLLKILLPDSARLQEEDADYANRKGFSKHRPALPLYTEEDAQRALKQVQPVKYNVVKRLSKSLSIEFIYAGHILGSSFIRVKATRSDGSDMTILFSGDVGRYDEPILKDPSPVEGADYLLVESTYGNRLHEKEDPKQRLAEIITSTAERGGKVIIPAFAVGRTQLIVYYLRELEDEGRIPILPVAVDSPMAASTTRLYSKHHEEHDLEMTELENEHENPLATHKFQLVQGRGGSKALDAEKGPAIIVSASGMATGGRVLHHLARYLPDPNSTVAFVGYQAGGTRGRLLEQGAKEIKMHGLTIPVNARIESLGSLSAHADYSELLRWMGTFKHAPKQTFIVHGEPEAAEAMSEKISASLGWSVKIPEYKEVVTLD